LTLVLFLIMGAAKLMADVPDIKSTGVVFGQITDATNNRAIQGVSVSIGEISSTTDSNGNYRLEGVPEGTIRLTINASVTAGVAPLTTQFSSDLREGTQTITAEATGYSTYIYDGLEVFESTETRHDISLSPRLTDAQMRFVLSWGASPSDLDSHLRTPYGTKIYYGNRGSATAPPYALLDVDDTNGYGPETVTIYQFREGTYHYFIYNYSGSPAITTSNAVVKIYAADGTTRSVDVPTSGTGRYWYVATVDGSTGRVTIINRIQEGQPGINSKEPAIMTAKPDDSIIMSGWSYEWDFGDETGSEEANPAHLYIEPGLYTVTLTARNGDVSATTTQTNLIEVVLNTSIEIETPGEFRLIGTYPNPFNPETTVRYEVPEAGMVGFEVHNLIGQQVLRIDESFINSGTNSVRVDATGWSSGVYLYTIKFGGQIKTGKMVLIK